MTTITNAITIKRPIEEIFAFIANYGNNIPWQTGIISAGYTSPEPWHNL